MLEDVAAEFIARQEGFRSSPYRDVGGVWTIGYGTTTLPSGESVTRNTPAIDEATGRAYLADYVTKHIMPKISILTNWRSLNQNQKVACIDLAYNIGPTAFVETSSVARAIEGWNLARVPADIMLWDKIRVGGKLTFSKGLRNRRQAEADLFQKPTASISGG